MEIELKKDGTPKFRVDRKDRIDGVGVKPGSYTPEALAKEINRQHEKAGLCQRYAWNAAAKEFYLIGSKAGSLAKALGFTKRGGR